MTTFTVMGWNLLNCGLSKYNARSGDRFLDVIVRVITQNNVAIVGLSEILSNVADTMGRGLTAKLDIAVPGSRWMHKASPQFGVKRKEQYLMLWNAAAFTNISFAHQFPNPSKPGQWLGFPKLLRDRPPFVGRFSRSGKVLAVAIMHSPGPGSPDPTAAAKSLALVEELRRAGEATVLLGDFNIKREVDAAKLGTNGRTAFADLVAAKFEQRLPKGPATSLPKSIPPNPHPDDCLSEPYDQVFTRDVDPNVSFFPDAAAEDLVDETQAIGMRSQNQGYLEQEVARLEGAWAGFGPAGYATLSHAFWAYRWYVSDHIPVVVDVKI